MKLSARISIVLSLVTSFASAAQPCASRLIPVLDNISVRGKPGFRLPRGALVRLSPTETFDDADRTDFYRGTLPKHDLVVTNDEMLKIQIGGVSHFTLLTDTDDGEVSALEFTPRHHRYLITVNEGRKIMRQWIINVDFANQTAKVWWRGRTHGDNLETFKLLATYGEPADAKPYGYR